MAREAPSVRSPRTASREKPPHQRKPSTVNSNNKDWPHSYGCFCRWKEETTEAGYRESPTSLVLGSRVGSGVLFHELDASTQGCSRSHSHLGASLLGSFPKSLVNQGCVFGLVHLLEEERPGPQSRGACRGFGGRGFLKGTGWKHLVAECV